MSRGVTGHDHWHDAAMLRLPAIVLTATLVLGGGAASAVVKNGTDGNDRLRGTSGSDTLRGKAGEDSLRGFGGDDLLKGGPDDDYLNGGPGLDDLGGGPGNDVILAGRDDVADRTYGQSGNDEIYVFGRDQASAGGGDDRIIATYPARGMFIMCGTGEDEVVFNQTPPPHATFDDCEDVHVESAG
jgi:Ca2+-binding RTX toxin-like protein